jgi:hypothetical protein
VGVRGTGEVSERSRDEELVDKAVEEGKKNIKENGISFSELQRSLRLSLLYL